MPHWEVRTSWPYCCEELLLGLWLYCCQALHWPYCCEELLWGLWPYCCKELHWPYCCEESLWGLWPCGCEAFHWPYCGEDLLLVLWLYCCEELHVWSTLKVSTSFIRGQVFRSSQPRFEETLGFGPRCGSDGKKKWKIKQDSQVVKQSCSAVRNSYPLWNRKS